MAVISPLALVPVIAVWLATVMLTGFVGLGTMLGTATLPVYFALSAARSPALRSATRGGIRTRAAKA